MSRPFINPNYDNDKRRHYKLKHAEELRQKMEPIWNATGAVTVYQKAVNFFDTLKVEDQVTLDIAYIVVWETEDSIRKLNPAPINAEEREFKRRRLDMVSGMMGRLRETSRFESLISKIMRMNPTTNDGEWIIINAQPKERRVDAEHAAMWRAGRERMTQTIRKRTNNTIKNAVKPKKERMREKRKEIESWNQS